MSNVCNVFRCSSIVYEDGEPVHPSHVDHVPGVSGSPPRHDQLLHQLPHLLLSLQAVQGCPHKHLQNVYFVICSTSGSTTTSKYIFHKSGFEANDTNLTDLVLN